MSRLKSRVGNFKMEWRGVPRGAEGTTHVQIGEGAPIEVRWRKDSQGIWVTFLNGIVGFDLQGERDENGRTVFRVSQRNAANEWAGLHCSYGETEAQALNRGQQIKAARIRAQMPGKILRILAQPGQHVERDQPIVVMEAMKMENEIRAAHAGKVSQVKVVEGQAVETGADLVLIEV